MRKILLFSIVSLFSLQAISQQIPEYCLENPAAHDYLTQVTYDPNNYDYTKITDYCDVKPYQYYKSTNKYGSIRKDRPNPVPIKLTHALDTASTLYISEKTDFTDAWTYTIDKDVDSVAIYNLIPGRTYYYKVVYPQLDGTLVRADSAVFKTTGTLRMLKIDGIFNVRDMGGWIGTGGYPLKYGKIIRGSRMNVNGSTTKIITQSGINELRRVGIKADLDMRNNSDAGKVKTSFLGSDIPIYNVEEAYRSRINTFGDYPQSIEGIQQLISWLKQDKPVYLHCSVGADRTGTVAYLVGALCGMSEDELCKEFELTSFSADSIVTSGKQEDLRRRRTHEGRFDDNDNPVSYQFASMVDKIKAFPGETLQEKVFYHLSTGAKPNNAGYLSRKISASDLNWLINYLIGPIELFSASQVILDKGQTSQIDARIVNFSAQNPNPTITYKSSDERVVTVSQSGLITAVGCSDQPVTVTAETNDGFSVSVRVTVNKIESVVPATATKGDDTFGFKAPVTNKVKDGSFEYGYFFNWMSAKDSAMTTAGFDLKKYNQEADSVYLESKLDGDDASEGSIRMEWTITKKRTYAFGFRVKNSTDLTTEFNQNLKIMLTNDGKPDDFADAIILSAPSYNGEWTEIQYIFTSTTQNRLRIVFTHLSQNGNNTCFDNFYLAELSVPSDYSAVQTVVDNTPVADDRIFNLAGQEVTNPGKGVYIRNGKKFIIK